jgi:hypothetical protein
MKEDLAVLVDEAAGKLVPAEHKESFELQREFVINKARTLLDANLRINPEAGACPDRYVRMAVENWIKEVEIDEGYNAYVAFMEEVGQEPVSKSDFLSRKVSPPPRNFTMHKRVQILISHSIGIGSRVRFRGTECEVISITNKCQLMLRTPAGKPYKRAVDPYYIEREEDKTLE